MANEEGLPSHAASNPTYQWFPAWTYDPLRVAASLSNRFTGPYCGRPYCECTRTRVNRGLQNETTSGLRMYRYKYRIKATVFRTHTQINRNGRALQDPSDQVRQPVKVQLHQVKLPKIIQNHILNHRLKSPQSKELRLIMRPGWGGPDDHLNWAWHGDTIDKHATPRNLETNARLSTREQYRGNLIRTRRGFIALPVSHAKLYENQPNRLTPGARPKSGSPATRCTLARVFLQRFAMERQPSVGSRLRAHRSAVARHHSLPAPCEYIAEIFQKSDKFLISRPAPRPGCGRLPRSTSTCPALPRPGSAQPPTSKSRSYRIRPASAFSSTKSTTEYINGSNRHLSGGPSCEIIGDPQQEISGRELYRKRMLPSWYQVRDKYAYTTRMMGMGDTLPRVPAINLDFKPNQPLLPMKTFQTLKTNLILSRKKQQELNILVTKAAKRKLSWARERETALLPKSQSKIAFSKRKLWTPI